VLRDLHLLGLRTRHTLTVDSCKPLRQSCQLCLNLGLFILLILYLLEYLLTLLPQVFYACTNQQQVTRTSALQWLHVSVHSP
jgi:hypothetical protein